MSSGCSLETKLRSHIDEEGFAVQEIGELVERLVYNGSAGFWDIQLASDHDIVGSIFGGQEENAVGVVLVVQEWDSSFTQITSVVLHLYHKI